jgi:hypothetical protein
MQAAAPQESSRACRKPTAFWQLATGIASCQYPVLPVASTQYPVPGPELLRRVCRGGVLLAPAYHIADTAAHSLFGISSAIRKENHLVYHQVQCRAGAQQGRAGQGRTSVYSALICCCYIR